MNRFLAGVTSTLLIHVMLCGCQVGGDARPINGLREVGYNVKPLHVFPPTCASEQGSTPKGDSRTFQISFPSTERMGIRLLTRTERDRPHSNDSAMKWEVHVRDSSGSSLCHWQSLATNCGESVPQNNTIQDDGEYVSVLPARLWGFPDGYEYITFEPGDYTVEVTIYPDLQDQRPGAPCIEVALIGRWYWPWP
jgi:hypothetical protein